MLTSTEKMYMKRIAQLFKDYHGTMRYSEICHAIFDLQLASFLGKLMRRGIIEKVSHGLYRWCHDTARRSDLYGPGFDDAIRRNRKVKRAAFNLDQAARVTTIRLQRRPTRRAKANPRRKSAE